jgi:hypothetical protein
MTMVLRLLGCLAVCLALVATAPAQDARVPSSPGEIKLSFAPVVKRVTPAVVNVYAARVVENRVPLFDDPIWRGPCESCVSCLLCRTMTPTSTS